MPVESNDRRQGATDEKLSKRAWRKLSLGVGFVFILAAICVAVFFMPGGEDMSSESARMKEYLDSKYGQQFVVENVRETGTGLAVKGSWRGDAYLKSDPSLKFEIRRDQTTGEIDFETFLQALWTRQGTPEVEEFLSREFPNNEGYVLVIEPTSSLYNSTQGETPSLEDALKRDRNLVSYSLSVRNVIAASKDEPSVAQLENALKVVDFVKEKNIRPSSYAYYNYRDTSFSARDEGGGQNYQYGVHVEGDGLQGINSISDLEKYFKVLR